MGDEKQLIDLEWPYPWAGQTKFTVYRHKVFDFACDPTGSILQKLRTHVIVVNRVCVTIAVSVYTNNP